MQTGIRRTRADKKFETGGNQPEIANKEIHEWIGQINSLVLSDPDFPVPAPESRRSRIAAIDNNSPVEEHSILKPSEAQVTWRLGLKWGWVVARLLFLAVLVNARLKR